MFDTCQLITENQVRVFLLDRTSDDNFLLDDVEFSPDEIQEARDMMLSKYQSTMPILGFVTEVPSYEALLGTAAILLRMKAINLTRNRLDYQNKNGTAVQDKNKGQEYLAIAKGLSDEFDQRVTALKVHYNIEACYGRVGSYYRWDGLHW